MSTAVNAAAASVDDNGRRAALHTSKQHEATLVALSIAALQRGQALWFRVSSSSMRPFLHVDDAIYIQPAQAHEMHPGDIIAFRSNNALVVHRLLARKPDGEACQFLQMGDAAHCAAWIAADTIVGRVMMVKRDHAVLDMQIPLARWWGYTMATLRYRLYLYQHVAILSLLLRGISRLWRELGGWYFQRCYRQNK